MQRVCLQMQDDKTEEDGWGDFCIAGTEDKMSDISPSCELPPLPVLSASLCCFDESKSIVMNLIRRESVLLVFAVIFVAIDIGHRCLH